MTNTIREQILAVRETGETNMFAIPTVQSIANREEYFDLVAYLMDKDNQKEYATFIITGEAPIEDESSTGQNREAE